jgi:alginate O-acetyltransferase complex protein AlgI
MLFCSQEFLLFFLAVFSAYWALPWHRARVWLLLAASVAFYAAWNRELAGLVCGTAALDYLLARGIDDARSPRLRTALLVTSVSVNLGVLGYFKYANFFLASLGDLLSTLGVPADMPTLRVIVPIGIAFYTFEAISYTVDVYRRHLPAERRLSNFLVFILFFPHLIAGPIVRGRDFLPQVRRPKRWNWLRIRVGLALIVLGMVKKMAIPDRMALFADPVFADWAAYRTSALWLAALAYVVQIYCDFSGYTDLARGTARLLGYRLAPNFELPYLAPNVSEFWRRWHVSLSSWMRDYVFFPLGGSRGRLTATCRNLLVVMLLCGLWHGAAWPFVTFGLIHGTWLCLHLVFRRWCAGRPRLRAALESPAGTALRVAGTLTLFTLTLVVFRSPSLAAAGGMLGGMLFGHAGLAEPMAATTFAVLAAGVAVGHAVAARPGWARAFDRWPPAAQGLACAAAVLAALVLAPPAGQAFVYFQF